MPYSTQAATSPLPWIGRRGPIALSVFGALLALISVVVPVTAARSEALTPVTIWGTNPPANTNVDTDTTSVELGTVFTPKVDGSATGVRFYKTAENTGTHVGNLWTSRGQRLASVTFREETAQGWQQATFSSPVQLKAGSQYVVSYFAPRGRYIATTNYYGATLATTPITIPSSNSGVYAYGSSSKFPSSSWRSSQYWTDLMFQPSVTTTTSAPVTTTTVGAGVTGVPAGTTLRASGSITVTTAGTVIDGLDVSGNIYVAASNVTIKRTRVRGAAYALIQIKAGMTGVRIEDVELDGLGTAGQSNSCGVQGTATVLRANIHSVENGLVPESGSVLQGNYIHHLSAPGSPHYDGIQLDGGQNSVLIENNTVDLLEWSQTAAVMIDNYFGPTSNITVRRNILKGGGYTVYADGQFRADTLTNIVFDGNAMVKGIWGYQVVRNASVTWTNNIDLTTGKSI